MYKGTQGYRFGLRKNLDKATKGDPMREEEKMENELAKSYIEDEPDEIVDPVEEVRDVVQDALDAEAEALIDLLSDNESKEYKSNEATISSKPLKEKFVKQKGKHANISMRQFWRYRMFYRNNMDDANKGKDYRYHWLWVMRKLAEFFVIIVENRSQLLY